jgi:hypothetical protein
MASAGFGLRHSRGIQGNSRMLRGVGRRRGVGSMDPGRRFVADLGYKSLGQAASGPYDGWAGDLLDRIGRK